MENAWILQIVSLLLQIYNLNKEVKHNVRPIAEGEELAAYNSN